MAALPITSIVQAQQYDHLSLIGTDAAVQQSKRRNPDGRHDGQDTNDDEGEITMALVQDIRITDIPRDGLFSGLRDALARRKVYRETMRELKSLSNRELADLGIHRSMITRVATEAAYGK